MFDSKMDMWFRISLLAFGLTLISERTMVISKEQNRSLRKVKVPTLLYILGITRTGKVWCSVPDFQSLAHSGLNSHDIILRYILY